MTEFAVVAQGLTRSFGEVIAVNNVDLSIKQGQIYGFLGPNGSGKTTILRLFCGLLTPTGGEVQVLGHPVGQQAEQLRQKIGYMTQKFSLYDDLTIAENMRFIAMAYGLRGAVVRDRIKELLHQYSLNDMKDRPAAAMSGGQRQRLALATATLHRPSILFLDEPTSAVDPENRRDFWEKLFDLSDEGTTVLVSTHYMDEAERCHNLAILQQGKLKLTGEPRHLMADLASRVIEIEGAHPRHTKDAALRLSGVRSAAQQGLQLRVLMQEWVSDPLAYMLENLPQKNLKIQPSRPSLEDVFVAATDNQGGS